MSQRKRELGFEGAGNADRLQGQDVVSSRASRKYIALILIQSEHFRLLSGK